MEKFVSTPEEPEVITNWPDDYPIVVARNEANLLPVDTTFPTFREERLRPSCLILFCNKRGLDRYNAA